MRYKYQLDNLNCAHCAGKIEAKIAETNGFDDVSFNFATKLLNFKSEKQNPVSEMVYIMRSRVESPKTLKRSASSNSTSMSGISGVVVFSLFSIGVTFFLSG